MGLLDELEAFRLLHPRFLPWRVFVAISEYRAGRWLGRALRNQNEKHHWQYMRGLAAGSGVSLRFLLLLNSLEPLLSSVMETSVVPGLGACSAVAVTGSRSATGSAVIARNYDYLPYLQPIYCVIEQRPAQGLRHLTFTLAPLAGVVDGVNEAGLALCYNYAYACDTPRPGATISMRLGEVMGRCKTVAEAASLLESTDRWGGGLILLADAAGDIGSLELSNGRARLVTPQPGQHTTVQTNQFESAAMREVQVSDRAVYSAAAPKALRGERVLQSPEQRSKALVQGLADARVHDRASLLELMSSHGGADSGTADTVCMHSAYWNTSASLQLFPRERLLRVSYSTACRADFVDFQL